MESVTMVTWLLCCCCCQERWRVAAEQAKAESAQRGVEEERRSLQQHTSMEREELERAKVRLHAPLSVSLSVTLSCAFNGAL